ncbi:hypothetical protein Godav_028127 [Gossypium davidsonii]|uniref:Uncharacterized protein n=1 Tax=Gossypium davidsonii TaxID=34287 RepID=A0A7J8RYE3_GOSDV|nr:hypothetical protein [Gossypium davidsonii]
MYLSPKWYQVLVGWLPGYTDTCSHSYSFLILLQVGVSVVDRFTYYTLAFFERLNIYDNASLSSKLWFSGYLQSFQFLQSKFVDVYRILPQRSIQATFGGVLHDERSVRNFKLSPITSALFTACIVVPVTNFFGSVMETIHTDAAYKALSRRNSGRFEDEMSLDQSVHHIERRMLIKVNDGDEIHDINPEGEEGASKCPWSTFRNKFQKAENVDSLVNYGLVAMIPLLVISTWLVQ